MKRLLFITFCIASLSIQAQKRITQFSIAAESGVMATKQAFTVYNIGFGGSAKVYIPVKKKNYLTGSFGVLSFSGRSGTPAEIYQRFGINVPGLSSLSNYHISIPPLTILPIKVGYRFNLRKTLNADIETGYTIGLVEGFDRHVNFNEVSGMNFSLGLGYLINKKLDISMRYEQWTTTSSDKDYTSFVGLRTLLMLDFKK